MLLELRCDGPLSTVAFRFNLRRYNADIATSDGIRLAREVDPNLDRTIGRGLQSSTFQLNVNTLCGLHASTFFRLDVKTFGALC
jgi:hypothetical protein